jgi:mono/diheme cytochrome c family protein
MSRSQNFVIEIIVGAFEKGSAMNLNRGTRRLAGFAVVITIGISFATVSVQAQDASAIYAEKCVSCHGPQGKGDGPAGKYLNPKPNDFAISLTDKTDDWIAKATKGGGKAVGLSPVMPPYPDLTDDQVKALVDYIKKLGS